MNLLIQLTIAGVVVFLFCVRNPHKDFLLPVSASIIILFVSRALFEYFPWSLIVWLFGAISLFVSYLIRFTRKPKLLVVDKLKWLGIVLLTITTLNVGDSTMAITYSYGTFYLTCVVLGIIFCFDLWKRNAGRRKHLAVVILSGLAAFSVIFLVYALVQKNAADKQQREVEINLEKAVKSKAQD